MYNMEKKRWPTMIGWFLFGFILGYLTIIIDFKNKETTGVIFLEEHEMPWFSPNKKIIVAKRPKKTREAEAPHIVFSDHMPLQRRHSHNFICSSEPT